MEMRSRRAFVTKTDSAVSPHVAGRFLAGDALRALAAFSVLAYHVAYAVATRDSPGHGAVAYAPFGRAGALLIRLDLGLYVFFVLSGYLLSRPFLDLLLGRRDSVSVAKYLRNRALRIVPAFWVVLTIVLVVRGVHDGGLHTSPFDIAAIFGFAQAYRWSRAAYLIGPAWTLGVEVAFYVFLPLIAVPLAAVARQRGSTIRTGWIITAVATLWLASITLRATSPVTFAWKFNFATNLFAFVPGIVLAAIEPTVQPRVRGSRWGAAIAAACLVGGLVALVGYHRLAPTALGFLDAKSFPRAVLSSIGTGLLVASPLLWQWTTGRPGILGNGILRWAGERSYSFYLLHWPLLYAVEGTIATLFGYHAKRAFAVGFVGVGVLTMATAALCYALVERTSLRLKTRY
jgi:peptidoglycan/LPS O-acetylase OafA/YrhL